MAFDGPDDWIVPGAAPAAPGKAAAPAHAALDGPDDWVLPGAPPKPAEPTEKPGERPPEDAGIFSSLASGITHGVRQFGATAQALEGEKPAPAAPPKTVGESPVELADLAHPYRLAEKVAYQFGAGAPVLAAGLAAGTAALPAGPLAGLGAGAIASGVASAAQELGPIYAEEVAKTPQDADGAWSRSLGKAAETGAFGSLGWAAFGFAPFSNMVRNLMFQAFAVQPGIGVGEQAVRNVQEGKPATEGLGDAAVAGVVGSAIPIAGIEGAKYLGHRLLRTPAQEVPGSGGASPQAVTPETTPPGTAPAETPPPSVAPSAAPPATGDQLPRAPGSEELATPPPPVEPEPVPPVAPPPPPVEPEPEPAAPPARPVDPEAAEEKRREELVETVTAPAESAPEIIEHAEAMGDQLDAMTEAGAAPEVSAPIVEALAADHAELADDAKRAAQHGPPAPDLTQPDLTSPNPTQPDPTAPYLTPPNLTQPYLTKPYHTPPDEADNVGAEAPLVIPSTHTKTGAQIWTVQLQDRVSTDAFKVLGKQARDLGGYYSSYRGRGALPGFIFKTPEAANDFAAQAHAVVARGETPSEGAPAQAPLARLDPNEAPAEPPAKAGAGQLVPPAPPNPTEPYQTKPDQTTPHLTPPNLTQPDHTSPDQTTPHLTPLPYRAIREDQAVTSTGRSIPIEYGISDAHDLITSHDDDQREIPSYPQELQPRDRSRLATADQISDLLRSDRFRPELLGEGADAGSGAPIVGPEGYVDSGNMRTMALRRAYDQNLPAAAAYRAFLEAHGYPIQDMAAPMLVRINRSGMPLDERAKFNLEANVPATAAMSATEQAAADARRIPASVLNLAASGDLAAAGNRRFVRAVLDNISVAGERGALMDAEGNLSTAGQHRLQAALLAKAYDDPVLLATLVEDPEPNIKAIGSAMTDAAPAWARMRAAVERGVAPVEADITRNLVDAAKLVGQARGEGQKIIDFVNQRDIFGGGIDPFTEAVLRDWLFDGDQLTRRVGREKIADALIAYADMAQQPATFAEVAPVSVRERIELAGQQARGAAADLFANREAAREPGRSVAVGPSFGKIRPEAQRLEPHPAGMGTPDGGSPRGAEPGAVAPGTSPNLTKPYPTQPNLTSPDPTIPNLTTPNLTTPNLTSPNPTQPYLAIPHLASPQLKLATAIEQALESGFRKPPGAHAILPADLQRLAEQIYGGTLASGKFSRADLYDALELAVNRHVADHPERFNPRAPLPDAQSAVRELERLKNKLPTQTVRAGEKDSMQQFSTPPDYAFTAAWAGNIRPTDHILEPSAGTGSLVAPAKNAGPRDITVNELSANRAPLVESLGPSRAYRENAEQLHNILPADVKPTLVLMNPPFSQTAGRMGNKMVMGVGAMHVEQALERLEPGGRLVAIVGRGMKMEGTGAVGRAREGTGAAFANWWRGISQTYDVRANLGIPGNIYGKYGTNFGTQLLVIDKAPPSGRPALTGEAKSLTDAMEMLDEIRNDRPNVADQPDVNQHASPAVVASGPPSGELGPAIRDPTFGGGVRGEPTDTGARPELQVGIGAGSQRAPGPELEPGGLDAMARQQPEGGEPIRGERHPPAPAGGGEVVGGGGAEPDGVVLRPEAGPGSVLPASSEPPAIETAETPAPAVRVDEIAAEPQGPGDNAGVVESVYERYKPQRIKIEGAQPHPGDLVQSAAMASVMPPMVDYAPRLPKELITKGGLSDAQLEAITYAGHAHSQTLPAEGDEPIYRRGFFVGDGTGVGKGRQIAGIIADNFNQGRTKALWISETPSLINDATRDWTGIGGKKAEIFPVSKIKAGADIKAEKGIGFLTYDTLSSYERAGKDAEGKTIKGQRRLDQLVNWLGKDFNGVIAFDESHNLGNSISTKGERGVKEASAKALAGIELQQKLPDARVVYISATGATEVMNLAYAERLGLWGRGTAFPDKVDFINKIGSGGIAAMELVARDMKAMGHYLSRNLSYDDVKYDRLEHQLTPQQREIYDGLAEGWQLVLRNIGAALQAISPRDPRTGQVKVDRQAKSNALSAFWSGHQRFFNQIITSMQMPSVINAVEGDIKGGRQAVLQLVNTNEASQKRAIAKRRMAEGADAEDLYEDLDLTPKDQLAQMVDKSFPTQQVETYVDHNGNEITRGVVNAAGEPVHNPAAVAMKEALLEKIGMLRVPDGPLEMLMNHFGADKVAEVTGRGERVVRKLDAKGVMRMQPETRSKATNEADAVDFQSGKKKILVFSQAGGTGRSYHAENGTPSADAQRSHYLVQAGWRADKAIQGFGRTHRTNQASAPIFHLVTTDLQGQRRFISSIARRLSQLGALTKGERRAGDQGLFSAADNLESPEARAALASFWSDMQRNRVEGIGGADFERQTGLALRNSKGEYTDPPEITQFLNRLLSFKYDTQNQVFGEFERRLTDATDRAAASGTLDVGTETLKGDRIRKEEEKTVYTDPQSGAETKYVRLGVDNKNHPASFDDVLSGKRMTAGREPAFFAVSKRSGKILAVSESSNATDAAGNVVEQYRLSGPMQWDYTARNRLGDARYWEKITDQARARQMWEQQVAEIPEYDTRNLHLVTGAVLPIWDRLQGSPRVYRLQTTDGERMLGREIPEKFLGQTLQALGAEASGQTYTPKDIADRILAGGRASLANGWTLKRSTVAGEPRIEVVGPGYTNRAELEGSGVFTERIGYDTRFFVPTGEGAVNALASIVERRPVVDMSGGTSGGLEETASPFGVKAGYRDQREEFMSRFRPEDPHGSARDWTIAEGVASGNEHLAAVDSATGEVPHAYTMSLPNAISFTDELMAHLRDPNNALVGHHNHPSGTALSGPDLRQLALPGLDTVVAHTHAGGVSAARLTSELKMEALSDPDGVSASIKHDYEQAANTVTARLWALVNGGKMSRDDANRLFSELVNRSLDAGGVIDYISSETVAPLSEGLARNIVRAAARRVRQDGLSNEDFDARVRRSTLAFRPDDILAGLPQPDEAAAAGRSGYPGADIARAAGARQPGEEAGPGLAEEPPPAAPEREEERPGGGPPRQPPPPGGGPPRQPPGVEPPEKRTADLDTIMTTDRRGIVDRVRDAIGNLRQLGLRELRQRWQDQLTYLEAEERKVGGGKLLPADESPSVHMRLARNSMMVVETQMKVGQVRYNPNTHASEAIPGTKGLIDIWKPLSEYGGQRAVDDYKLWAVVKRAEGLAAEGRERLIPQEMIDKYRNLDQLYTLPNGSNLFHEVDAERQQFHKNLLDYGEAAGIISPESRKLFERDDYIPFYRMLQSEDEARVTGPAGGRRSVRSPIQRLRGGEAKLNDVAENEVRLVTAMTQRSMENIARRWTVAQLAGTESLLPLSKAARAELDTPEARTRLSDMGLDPDAMSDKAKEAARGLFAMLRKGDPNLYTVMQDGKPLHYEIANPQLVRSINAFGPQSTDALTRILSGPARLLRSAVVFDPAFMLAHNFRMSLHSFLLTGTSPFASMGQGIKLATRGLDPIAIKLMASGAMSGKYDIGYPRHVREEIESPAFQNSLLNTPLKAAKFLQRMSEAGMRASDLGPRVAVYKRAKAQGASELDAINQARDLLDFSTHGDGGAARFLAQTIPFLNARWQGIARTGRGLAGDNRNAIMMRMSMVTAATIALWYENHDKPEWQRLEDWDKQYAWHFWVGGLHYRLPKPFELGAVTGSLPEIILDYFDSHVGKQAQQAAASLFLNIFKFNPIPVAVRPAIEAYFNTDSYTGRPIVNENIASLQHSPTTSPTIVKLTDAINAVSPAPVAPEIAEHLLRGYLAGWGGYITAAADTIGETAGWLPSQAAWRTTDYPVINRFVRETPEAGNRIQTDFYNMKAGIGQIAKNIKFAESEGDLALVKTLTKEHPEWNPGVESFLQKEAKVFAQERKQLRTFLDNPGHTAEAKRDRLDEYYVARDAQMDKLAPFLRNVQQGHVGTP